ncbi:hypothetical protein C8E03_12410 [Lachnotalea glycerini]|uniref:Zn-finger containing protein n=1 Tax=Lachnotalea glycerini TaxID=1763509 RepID=A0A318ELR3_9FIRM|nr:hypothetical protein [Lachnotalea glycerini]PXV84607.1 hypothetical protein C8E03_12410 [Lachnotalea glycerini]
MKEKIRHFMAGRYGVDELTRFILLLDCLLMVFSLLLRNSVMNFICIFLILLCYLRMFSKNYSQRFKENQMYLKYYDRFANKYASVKYAIQQHGIYHIYKCPSCKQKIRIPKGKGKISITCPKCNKQFIKHS